MDSLKTQGNPVAESIMKTKRLRWWHRLFRRKGNAISSLMRVRLGMVARGDYSPLGMITMLNTTAGWIQFPTGGGPALARFDDGAVDLLDAWEWEGLPDRYEGTNELCPDCAVRDCPECFPGDKNLEQDTVLACFVVTKNDFEAQETRSVHFEPGERLCCYGTQTECCGGAGVIVSQDDKICPSCEGTGKVKCRKCKGTGHLPSGFKDWDAAAGKSPSGKFCASCGGSGRKRAAIAQNLPHYLAPESFHEPFSSAGVDCPLRGVDGKRLTVLRDLLYLGPIKAIMVSFPGGSTQPWKATADAEGNFPHIVSNFSPGARAVILGGVLRATAQHEAPHDRRRPQLRRRYSEESRYGE